MTVMVGRSHGIHGEPISFGFKLAIWYEEMCRHRERLRAVRQEIAVGKLSGAMGTFAHQGPEVEEFVCAQMGLRPDPVSNQVVQRDRHASYATALALLAASLLLLAQALAAHLEADPTREATHVILLPSCGHRFLDRSDAASHYFGDRFHLLHHLCKFFRLERLFAVRNGVRGIGVHFDDKPVRARGDSGARDCRDVISMTRRVRWIENDGQMREIFQHGNRVDIGRVARGRFECADAALAQDDLFVAAREEVFGRHEQFFDGGAETALEQNTFTRFAEDA